MLIQQFSYILTIISCLLKVRDHCQSSPCECMPFSNFSLREIDEFWSARWCKRLFQPCINFYRYILYDNFLPVCSQESLPKQPLWKQWNLSQSPRQLYLCLSCRIFRAKLRRYAVYTGNLIWDLRHCCRIFSRLHPQQMINLFVSPISCGSLLQFSMSK